MPPDIPATRFVVKDKGAQGGPDNFDLVRSLAVSKSGRDFTTPVPVQALCTAADELHPWLTADGKEDGEPLLAIDSLGAGRADLVVPEVQRLE